MTPLASGQGAPLPTREQRVREHAAKLAKTYGIRAIIETWFVDDLIDEIEVQPPGWFKSLCAEFGLNAGTFASYMTAANHFTKQERRDVDPESNLPMTLWKFAYEKSETDNSDGLPKASILTRIRSFIEALNAGQLWYEDEDSEGIATTVSNLKSHLQDMYDLHTDGVGPSIAREFYPAIEVTPQQAIAACEAIGIDKKPVLDDEKYDHFAKVTFIRRRKKVSE